MASGIVNAALCTKYVLPYFAVILCILKTDFSDETFFHLRSFFSVRSCPVLWMPFLFEHLKGGFPLNFSPMTSFSQNAVSGKISSRELKCLQFMNTFRYGKKTLKYIKTFKTVRV